MKQYSSHDSSRASIFRWVIVAIALFASGCGSNQSRLVGSWTADLGGQNLSVNEVSPLDVDGQRETPDEAGQYSIRLEFYRGGRLDTVTSLPQIRSQKSGRWRLLSFDETKQIAMIECDLLQQRTLHEVEFLDARTIRLVPPNMAGLKLKLEFKKEP